HGDTEWTPPPHLDSSGSTGQPRTNMHHPEKLLHADEDDETE
ncbi:hypothetical protein PJP10_25810, partial [Mycobacterium kansasii]